MNWLEARFRRKFEAEGDGYRFRQVDREVIFDRETVERLVADWRKTWFSPWLWGSLLVFGVALPAIAGSMGVPGWEPLLVVALLTWITCMVVLAAAGQPLQDAAFARESVGPGTGRSAFTPQYVMIGIAFVQLGMVRPNGLFGYWGYSLWGFLLLLAVVQLARAMWKQRRARAA